jgi:hypothetical protein
MLVLKKNTVIEQYFFGVRLSVAEAAGGSSLMFFTILVVDTACSVFGQREVQANDGERGAIDRLPEA